MGWIYILQHTFTRIYDGSTFSNPNIHLEIIADCATETISIPAEFSISDDTYTIYDPEIIKSSDQYFENWTSSRASCHITYSIQLWGKYRSDFAQYESGVGIRIYS